MSKIINLTYCGMEGQGPTVAKAKQDAAKKIEAALYGSYCPVIRSFRGHTALIYRSPEGWHYAFLNGSDRQSLGYSSPRADFCEAIRDAVLQLAMHAWQPEDGLKSPVIEETGSQTTDGRWLRSEFASWAKFQLLYRAAKERGLNEHESHTLACGCIGRDDLAPLYRELTASLAA